MFLRFGADFSLACPAELASKNRSSKCKARTPEAINFAADNIMQHKDAIVQERHV